MYQPNARGDEMRMLTCRYCDTPFKCAEEVDYCSTECYLKSVKLKERVKKYPRPRLALKSKKDIRITRLDEGRDRHSHDGFHVGFFSQGKVACLKPMRIPPTMSPRRALELINNGHCGD